MSRTVENLRNLTWAPNCVSTVITDFFITRVFKTALASVYHWFRSWKGTIQSKPYYFIFRRNALLSFFCRGLGFKSYLFLSLFPNIFQGSSLPSNSFQTPRSSIPSLSTMINVGEEYKSCRRKWRMIRIFSGVCLVKFCIYCKTGSISYW